MPCLCVDPIRTMKAAWAMTSRGARNGRAAEWGVKLWPCEDGRLRGAGWVQPRVMMMV